ncbi:PREDICTED: AP-4 complex accessory subunit tepsin, partial [Myotis davidii]|uniref:AP-4 complex accessory subunit tepsin n=1 Tax=Myotis davidii TaxID=225400 RepID=UPI000766F16F
LPPAACSRCDHCCPLTPSPGSVPTPRCVNTGAPRSPPWGWLAPVGPWAHPCAPPTHGGALAAFQLPVLLKGTSDDDAPCPGYLFEEIAKISHESLGSSQCLLEYLLNRLHSGSGRVKLKVLKIMLHLCAHGSSSFLLILKRNPAFIQEAAGTSPAERLSRGAFPGAFGFSLKPLGTTEGFDLGSTLFSDTLSPPPPSQPPRALPPAGMGSQSRPQGALQGFGYSKEHGPTGSTGEALLATLQKAAEVVASAVCPGPEGPGSQGPLLQGDAYQPAVTPAASHGHLAPANPPPGALPGARATRHQPGQAGGGWDEQDSSPGSQGSCQDNGQSRASGSGTWSGSDSPSGASGVPGDLAERVEAVTLSDCQQELSLVQMVTQGPRPFLSQEEAQHFVKECGLLRPCALQGPQDDWALTSSLSPAVQILRHLEASCRQHAAARRPEAEPNPAATRVGASDLLTDTVPFTGGPASLQPLSSTLLSPRGPAAPPALGGCLLPGHGDSRKAEPRPEQGRLGSDAPNGGPESGPYPSGCLRGPGASSGHKSLFAGMQLVACPRLVEAGTGTQEPPQPPWMLSHSVAAPEPPGSEPSAFAFLNS